MNVMEGLLVRECVWLVGVWCMVYGMWCMVNWILLVREVGVEILSVILLIKASATTGAFYFFNHHQKSTNQPSISGTIEHDEY